VLRCGPIVVAVSAGGSPALAAGLRDALAGSVTDELVKLAEALKRIRPVIKNSGLADRAAAGDFSGLGDGGCGGAALKAGGNGGLSDWLRGKFADLPAIDFSKEFFWRILWGGYAMTTSTPPIPSRLALVLERRRLFFRWGDDVGGASWEAEQCAAIDGEIAGVFGMCLILGALVWRSIDRGNGMPLEDNFETLATLALLLAGFTLYVQRAKPIPGLDWFLMPIVIVMLLYSALFGIMHPGTYEPAGFGIWHSGEQLCGDGGVWRGGGGGGRCI